MKVYAFHVAIVVTLKFVISPYRIVRGNFVYAVGHETDYTLADYAADMRGATPSHAAEIAVLPLTTLQQHLQQKLDYLQYVMDQTLQQKRIELSTIFNRRLGFPALQLLRHD